MKHIYFLDLCYCGCNTIIYGNKQYVNHHHPNGCKELHWSEESNKQRSETIKKHQFNEKNCVCCNELYLPTITKQKYCKYCLKFNRHKLPYTIKANEKRRNQRTKIQDFWGRNGRIVWKESEKIALKLLDKEGFSNIILLTDIYPQGFFDIKANDMLDNICLFQVTTRTHTSIKKARTFANILGINNFYILFIKTDLTAYILRKVHMDCDYYSIDNLNEVKMI